MLVQSRLIFCVSPLFIMPRLSNCLSDLFCSTLSRILCVELRQIHLVICFALLTHAIGLLCTVLYPAVLEEHGLRRQ